MKNNLIYNIHDRPKTVKELLLYGLQQMLSVLIATILIANICGTPISSCLAAACLGTLLYQVITNFNSPMFISSCGATCSAVIGALAVAGYDGVLFGGVIIAAVYFILAWIISVKGIEFINKIFPATIVGSITIVIGCNLATFIPTYVQVGGQHSNIGIAVAIITMITVAICSKYGKGMMKTIPFLIGLLVGYVVCVILTLCGIEIIDFSAFENMKLFSMPDFAFTHLTRELTLEQGLQIALMFIPVALAGSMEHMSDHAVLSNIIGTDLREVPGLDRTLLGDGLASLLGTFIGGLPNTSYGESIATTGFSRVASVSVISAGALMLGVLSFIEPVQVFMNSIPSCVFGGCAMILYGYIAASGLKTILNSKIDLEDTKNLIVVSVILTVGVSSIWFLSSAFAGVSLALVLGVILNILL